MQGVESKEVRDSSILETSDLKPSFSFQDVQNAHYEIYLSPPSYMTHSYKHFI